jgi:hypothetical protein
MRGISKRNGDIFASQEGLFSMELVGYSSLLIATNCYSSHSCCKAHEISKIYSALRSFIFHVGLQASVHVRAWNTQLQNSH